MPDTHQVDAGAAIGCNLSGHPDVLYLDLGNHRLKWSYMRGTVNGGCMAHRGGDWVSCLKSFILRPLRARINLSPGHRFYASFQAALAETHRCDLDGIEPQPTLRWDGGSLSLAYAKPQSLGADRWCALIACAHHFASDNVVLIDAGSAVSVDFLGHPGRHLGGYIIPSAPRMAQASAALIGTPMPGEGIDGLGPRLAPGRASAECVHRGSGLAVYGFAREICNNAAELFAEAGCKAERPRVVLTGGDGEALASALAEAKARHYKDLVIEGLRLLDRISPPSGLGPHERLP